MNNLDEQLVKIIDFWQKNTKTGLLLERKIIKDIDLKSKEIIDIVGSRRSGKSSVLKLLIRKLNTENFLYINFEDPFFIDHNKATIIEEIIEVYKNYFHKKLKYLFFDEIQEIKNWERSIRKLRDSEEYKIFITGSSSRLLSKEVSSLITGRHLSYQVFPLSFSEFLSFRNFAIKNQKGIALNARSLENKLQQYLKIGGFPEPVLTNNQILLKNYFFDILEKDIVRRYEIREKSVLERLALYLLTNSGNITSIESLKKTFVVSFSPIVSYLEYLKESFLIYELPQFSYSLKKQEKAFKKFYSIDTGLSNAVSFRFSQDKGRILENAVMIHLKRKYRDLFYYRTKNNLEVDFLVKEKNHFQKLIQVVWNIENENVKKRELKALTEAMEELKINEGLVLTTALEEKIKIGKNTIKIIPAYKWFLEK